VVNLRAKKLLGNEHVIGETVTDILGRRLTIVGVTEDVVVADAADELKAAFFMPVDRLGLLRYIYAKVNPVNRKAAEAYILQIIREYLPATIDYKLSSLSEIISKTRQTENTLLGLISLFAVITAVISLSGVYSSVVLATGRRRKEVAIRKINGATLGSIIRLFLRTYVGILFVAAIPAFALVYFAAVKWLESYAYRISISFSTFAVIFAALNGLLILTVIYQLIKTARLNPAETVKRSE
jgi:ABC-type antimicrobial peptide transport system permease subunit